jgi:hypothetical protein
MGAGSITVVVITTVVITIITVITITAEHAIHMYLQNYPVLVLQTKQIANCIGSVTSISTKQLLALAPLFRQCRAQIGRYAIIYYYRQTP